MNFEPSRPFPLEMYLAMGQETYLSPTREIDPYADLSLTDMAHGYFSGAPLDAKSPLLSESRDSDPEKVTAEISKGLWADPVETILRGRSEFLTKSVEDILSMIQEREDMKAEHLARMDQESCEAKTRIFAMEDWQPAMNKEADKIRTNAEKEISGLEREKRMEEIACWRDVSRMRMELQGVLEQLSNARRKESFLGGDRSEAL